MVLDFMDRVAGQFGPRVSSPASLLKFTELDPSVQRHLAKVYLTLCTSLAVCAAGCAIGTQFGFLHILSQLAAFACLLGLAFTPALPERTNQRYALLGGFAFSQGCSLSPLVSLASEAYPGVLMTALLSTSAVFLCFTVSALLSKRRTFLYLGGYLSSAALALLVLRSSMWLFGAGNLAMMGELYAGILLFSAYILFDTQVIVEKAYAGNMDHIRHAQDLFLDILALFVRILVLLMRNAAKKQEQESQSRRKRRQ